ncbi:MAG TPA: trypsin-like peptidase domain-containing protein, partial [Stackebrandtia sp.]|uniref:S1C family serine protease n=1 Tax=Stackebrandtia sp. TaxID=2023065 RepID=UPI002D73776B
VPGHTGQFPAVPGHTAQLPPMGPPPPGGPPPMGAAPYGGPPVKKGPGAGMLVAGALVVALLAGGTGGAVGYLLSDGSGGDSPSSLVGDNATISDVAKAVQPSVVDITSDKAEGSGVIYDTKGHIITNNHVASSGTTGKLKVTFADGSSAQAHITGTDPSGDLAVIQVDDAKDLTPIKFGDSDKLDVGDTVLAIGSPLGLQGSVTSGIVSAKNRTVQAGGEDGTQATTLEGMIQTDAAINPGNSGGALVNGKGQLVGINTIIATAGNSEGSVGLGFAIPSSTVKDDAQKLIESGNGGGGGGGDDVVKHAYLGITVADNVSGDGGAIVSSVQSGTPADKAGLKEGDVITKIGDTDVKSASDVVSTVQGAKPGTKMDVTYTRGGDSKTVTVKLATAPTN